MASLITLDRRPPCDIESERALLGALLTDDKAVARTVSVLPPDAFYEPAHKTIYAAVKSLFPGPVDAVTVGNLLRDKGQLDGVGGRAYLSQLISDVYSVAGVESYIKALRDKHIDRSLIKSGVQMVQLAYELADADEKKAKAGELVFKLDMTNGPAPAAEIALERLQEVKDCKEPPGVKTFSMQLNSILSGGFKPSRYYIIAGSPGGGKSVLLENLLRKAAFDRPDQAVLLVSLEMDKAEIVDRQLCSMAQVHNTVYEARAADGKELERLAGAMSKLGTVKFLIDDEPAQTPMQILAKALHVKAQHGLTLLGIDYIQLLELPDGYETRAQEVSKISRQIKLIAKTLQVPVIALSQMSREGRRESETKPPRLSDLKESGSLEQDADCVIFIWQDPNETDPNWRKLMVAKQRGGPTGEAKVKFHGGYYTFDQGR